ncbi:histidine kinase [Natronomonas sp. EA1]|uniref:histidine kinase n=1 Tax=Natronomonas sp. EA1 TaxID=3421655 RepID=UPI003EBAFD47
MSPPREAPASDATPRVGTIARVGIIASADHAVFGEVARRLAAEGVEVVFLPPGVSLSDEQLRELSLLVNKKVRWPSFDALRRAEELGVPTWNGYAVSLTLANRLAALAILASAGFEVPPVTFDPPAGDYVSKAFFDMGTEPSVNRPGDFYQPLLRGVQYDLKYYAVDDGETVHVACVLTSPKLGGGKGVLGRIDPDPAVVDRLRRLVRSLGVRSLGVDLVQTEGRLVAVDCNVAPSFRDAGLEAALVDSILSAAGLRRVADDGSVVVDDE